MSIAMPIAKGTEKMRQSFLFLIIGLLLGYIIGQKEMQKRAPPEETSSAHETTAASISHPAVAAAPAPLSARAVVNSAPGRVFITHHAAPVQVAPQKKKVDILINEENIAVLEDNWLSLRDQAWSLARDGGWEIHFKTQDSLFKRLGFEDGDFVSSDNIRTVLQNDDHKLVERATNILNEIVQ
jgi:hypothetical protein